MIRLTLNTGVMIETEGEEFTAGAYVRVLRPNGTEAGWWDKVEWQECPELVMGAILKCAANAHLA